MRVRGALPGGTAAGASGRCGSASSCGTTAATAIAVPVPSRNRRRVILFFIAPASSSRLILETRNASPEFAPTIWQVTSDFLEKLAAAAGPGAPVAGPAELITYESDALVHLRATPGAVVLPATAA